MVNFGKPETTTQVGVENQAKIPSVMENYEPSGFTCYGLPIPVTWVRKTSSEEAIESNNDLLPLPGLSTEPWSAIEHKSFLLGLYVFSKNFGLVKRFVGSKRMRSIISYYYREFHKSDDHHSWSKWRKDRRKRPQYARKLFTGWSHQELISRLSSNVSDGCKDQLIFPSFMYLFYEFFQDGTKYIEGRLSLTRFIFNLKHNVGMNLLVEAVAIGQEERDILEFRQINDWSYVSVEVPIGNASSSLSPQEILKILKGGARLSKSRSSDLFWDAVWPRLLARGWHSVQPRNNVHQNSKNWVFLVPGVIEFSRNELEKGIHYFDSLTDVLSKVASDPQLLELESEKHESVDLDTNRDSNDEEHQAKSSEFYSESKPVDDTVENIGFPEKTTSGNGKHQEIVEEPCSKNKLDQGIIVDVNLSQMALDSDPDQLSLSANPTTNQLEFSNAGAVIVHQPVLVPQRYSTRSRMLSTKALEALAFGYLSPKKKRKRAEEKPPRRYFVPRSCPSYYDRKQLRVERKLDLAVFD
ncbi:Homeodomain-like protein [Cynara cardunculus var. scolymus]|uniref:Homeodomain-like protein n=1 Tax=Cynara cardunculus var. scolymus TaxID=59895 RepID=A0A103XPC4_CYNCS|nr:Homeodomain-like protein [Cynara cardunculus var. scolymus]